MRAWVGWIAGAVVMVGGAAVAQQRDRLPPECRQQLIEMCKGAEGGIRNCARTAFPKLSDECRKAASESAAARAERPAGMHEYAYGSDPKQRLDLMVPTGATKAPLLFFVHGGGWSIGDKAAGEATKAPWANGLGWAFASANYRLVPQATVEQQAADLANAIAWVRANAAKQGLDPDRIVLMGHSAGAHLVALLGTDTSYLAKAGVPLSAIRGIVLLDGAGYDIAQQMGADGNGTNPMLEGSPGSASKETNPLYQGGNQQTSSPLSQAGSARQGQNPASGGGRGPTGAAALVKPMYDAAFGNDPMRQAALSPTLQTAPPNVAKWLILPIERRSDSQAQSKGLADALGKAGARATVIAVPGESHGSLNKGLDEKGDFATDEVERFLAGVR